MNIILVHVLRILRVYIYTTYTVYVCTCISFISRLFREYFQRENCVRLIPPYRANTCTRRGAYVLKCLTLRGLSPTTAHESRLEYVRICSGIFNSNLENYRSLTDRRKRFDRSFLEYYQCTITKNDLARFLVAA